MINQLIQNISDSEINSFFRKKISGYRPSKEELDYLIPENGYEKFTSLNKLGEWTYGDSDEQLVFSCKYEGELTARSSKKKQYDLAKKVLKEDFKDGAIFVFYDQNGNFRFSFIRRNYDEEASKYTPFKRYTYFVDPNKNNKTFKRRIDGCSFKSLEDIQDAFSVEPLSKLFYKDLSHWYFASLNEVKFPNDRDENEYSLHANAMIRMITRIMFVWFMKQKELVPNDLFDKEKLDDLLNYSDSNDSTYYKAILQNLFFATLNTPREKERKFVKEFQGKSNEYGVQNFFRYKRFLNDPDRFLELMDTIPFLNGGLFENLDIVIPEDKKKGIEKVEIRIDCFSNPKKNESKLRVPDYLFFGTRKADISEYYESGNYGDVEITGLIDILNRYDFTIDENTPYDQEVALDPELLGLVFENLLASYNPETQSTARKESGSFYTPRPIVDYMVEESLVHYISNDTGLDIEQLRLVFSSTDNQPFDQEADRALIIKSISNLKIIDPACGSGAFPMGALQKMVHALAKLDPGNEEWKKNQEELLRNDLIKTAQTASLDELKAQLEADFDNHLHDPDYARKLYLIKNCLYGVDIQPIAMQISKLRFFISLLVEQHIDREDVNYGIIALPNLETKFVAANTLIKIKPPVSGKMGRANSMFLKNRFVEEKEAELEQVRQKYFSARTSKTKEKHRKRDKELRQEIAEILVNDGWNTDEAQKITQWDPFNPNSKSKWFDCEWMFGNKRFDIVIGNPPYIQLQKALPGHDSLKYGDVYKNIGYSTFKGRGDIYCLFYEKGLEILNSNGLLCYITSNSWMLASYGKPLRKLFSIKEPKILIELGPGVFDAATVDVNILLVKNQFTEDHNLKSLILKDKTQISNISNDSFTTLESLSNDSWIVLDKEPYKLKVKIESLSTLLKNCNVNISRGIITGFNEAYIIDGNTKEELCKLDPVNANIIKPVLRGRDISRHNYSWANKWVLIVAKNFGKELQNSHPIIYQHLLQYEEQLKNRGQVKLGTHHWLELDNSPNEDYINSFLKEKIVWGEISDKSKFCYDNEGYFVEATAFVLTGENVKYLSALLNSNLSEWYFNLIGTTTGMGTNRWKKYKIERFPVRIPSNDILSNFTSILDNIISKKEKSEDTSTEEQQIDLMVYKLYDLTYDEVLIVDPETPIIQKDYEAFKL